MGERMLSRLSLSCFLTGRALKRRGFLGPDVAPSLRRARFCLCCPVSGLQWDLCQVAQSCFPSLSMQKMSTITWLFSQTLPRLFCFACQLFQAEAVHLVLLLLGCEHTVPPHLTMLPNNKCLSFQQGQRSQFCRLPE